MYKLVQISGAGAGRSIPLVAFQNFGRAANNNIVVDDPHVSREQGVIHVDNQHVTVVIRDGAVPIMLNGQKVANCSLREGDVVTIGSTQFQLQLASDNAPSNQVTQAQPAYAANQPYQTQFGPPHSPLPAYPQIGNHFQQGGPSVPGGIQVNVLQQNNNTGLWVLLAILFAGPLLCVSLIAFALLPFTMCIVGTILLVIGLAERNRWTSAGYPVPTGAQVKIYGGGISLALGLIWIFAAFALRGATPPSNPSYNSPSYNSAPYNAQTQSENRDNPSSYGSGGTGYNGDTPGNSSYPSRPSSDQFR
ncbi:MAG TPA: FHA domain-containing protein [Fimbriimonadaceae bacterium]|jgi:pSer/pThr/pTyr-binding forkhead associated (FHA) protein